MNVDIKDTTNMQVIENKPERILLDTNVWRYLSDCNAVDALARVARASNVQILVSPSTVYEALRTRDEALQQRLALAMCDPRWKRLMPEAYTETRELLFEITRLRPGWLKRDIDRGLFMRLKHDWSNTKNGFWARTRHDPMREAARLQLLGDGSLLEKARKQSENRRKEMTESEWKEPPPLRSMRSRFKKSIPGWRGDDVESWRVDGWTTTSHHLSTDFGAYFDWLHGAVSMPALRGEQTSWLEFWLYEVDKKNLPLFWLRWAFECLQGFRKVTDGTPCDSQLAAYLPEADTFVSADKAMVWMLDRCRSEAPCALPRSFLIAGGENGVDALLNYIER